MNDEKRMNELKEAIKEYLLHGTHPSVTVGNCDNMRDFQKVVKVSDKYAYAVHNDRRLMEKTFRVFASLREEDGIIGKCKGEGKTVEKFANTPEKCFIENGNVKDMPCPPYLDKKYYVDMTITRLKEKFGVCVS